MTTKINPTIYIDNVPLDISNIDDYLTIIAKHGVIPEIDEIRETETYKTWYINYSGGWGGGTPHILLWDKEHNVWKAILHDPATSLFEDASKYYELRHEYICLDNNFHVIQCNDDDEVWKYACFVWTSPHLEDILEIAFNDLSHRHYPKYDDFDHRKVCII